MFFRAHHASSLTACTSSTARPISCTNKDRADQTCSSGASNPRPGGAGAGAGSVRWTWRGACRDPMPPPPPRRAACVVLSPGGADSSGSCSAGPGLGPPSGLPAPAPPSPSGSWSVSAPPLPSPGALESGSSSEELVLSPSSSCPTSACPKSPSALSWGMVEGTVADTFSSTADDAPSTAVGDFSTGTISLCTVTGRSRVDVSCIVACEDAETSPAPDPCPDPASRTAAAPGTWGTGCCDFARGAETT
mmetsp:Transcript_133350/g.231368  ORF Transcript_133350/g.231368 Transcript_133350/m.231368 type:complete len:248 (-) Transcript_133350:55-798(-)